MGNSSSSGRRARAQPEAKSSKDEIPAQGIIVSVDDIHADFAANSNEPRPYQILVAISGQGYRNCYLDTKQNAMAFQTPQDPVTFGNLSLKWLMRNVGTKDPPEPAFHISNFVTDAANPTPPIGVPRTYLTQTNQFGSGEYNLQLLGDGVKIYLEPGPKNRRAIAMFTYLDEDQVKSNKYYLRPYTEDNRTSIIAELESDLESDSSQRYIFQFRSSKV